MSHINIPTTVNIFDIVYLRAEYWRKALGDMERDRFYNDALMMYLNNLGKWYPDLQSGALPYIQENQSKLKGDGND